MSLITAISLVKMLFRVLLRGDRINYLYDAYNTSKNIFILGNGLSLDSNLKDDVELLKSSDVFALNKFCLTDEFLVIKPNRYVLLDPAFHIENTSYDKFTELRESVLASFSKNITWPITLYIPQETDMKEKWSNLTIQNTNITVKYINTGSFSGFKNLKHFLYKYN